MRYIPFTCEWIKRKCKKYLRDIAATSYKSKNYKIVRNNIQGLCTFCGIKIPLKNIIVLKNYYCKHSLLVSVKPIFGFKKIIFSIRQYKKKHNQNKEYRNFEILYVPRNFSEFAEYHHDS